MAFLRDTVPEHAGNRDDRELYRDVVRYEASGRSIGLATELAFGKWAYLMAMSRTRTEKVLRIVLSEKVLTKAREAIGIR